MLESRELLSAVTIQFPASEDTTIYETGLGNLSNGAGQYLVVGGEGSDELARRGLIRFDLSSTSIPQGSVVVDATLTMNLAYSFGDATNVELFRVTKGWGEAGSDAPGIEIDGAAAQQFDATWLFSYFAGSAWANPGGDFLSGSSGSVRVQETGVSVDRRRADQRCPALAGQCVSEFWLAADGRAGSGKRQGVRKSRLAAFRA